MLCLSLVSSGLSGSPRLEQFPGRQVEREGAGSISTDAALRPTDMEHQSAAQWLTTRRRKAEQPLADKAGSALQPSPACEVGGLWSSICIWRSWIWRLLVKRHSQPTYRWQEREDEGLEGVEWGDSASGRHVRKRALKEITIPHIIHQVLHLPCTVRPGIFSMWDLLVPLLINHHPHISFLKTWE